MSQHAVMISVVRENGTTEQVRVGTAFKDGENFRLEMGQLTISGMESAAPAVRSAGPGAKPTVFPNYGRSKGGPIAGASTGDLEFYAGGCRRTLDDPGKARWHDKERDLLAAIEAEMQRSKGGGAADDGHGVGRDFPPPSNQEAPPPFGDDDIPF